VNLKEGEVEELDAKIWPDDREGSYKVPFTKVLYIESSDFRLKDAKDYYGLAPGKSVLLRLTSCFTICLTFQGHL
jgi:glutaminyl-tRNA synthetase